MIWYEQDMNGQGMNGIEADTSGPKSEKHPKKSINHFFGIDVSVLNTIQTLFVPTCSYLIPPRLKVQQPDLVFGPSAGLP